MKRRIVNIMPDYEGNLICACGNLKGICACWVLAEVLVPWKRIEWLHGPVIRMTREQFEKYKQNHPTMRFERG